MNYLKAGNIGLALDSRDPEIAKLQDRHSDRIKVRNSNRLQAHFVLERYAVDDEGNVCLTPSLPIDELPLRIELIRAALESLLRQAREHSAHSSSQMRAEPAHV